MQGDVQSRPDETKKDCFGQKSVVGRVFSALPIVPASPERF